MLDASKFSKSVSYNDEVKKVNLLIAESHQRMISKESFAEFSENFLRNVLVQNYLRKIKQEFGIGYLGFEIESGEITLDNEKVYFIDIKVLNVGNKDLLDEDEYFAYECKRIDEGNNLEGKYVNEGILRFVHGKYSAKMPVAGMVGFIQEGSVVTIVKDLNNLLKNHTGITTLKNLTANNLLEGVDVHYESQHDRPEVGDPIDLHHLMLDMTPILK